MLHTQAAAQAAAKRLPALQQGKLAVLQHCATFGNSQNGRLKRDAATAAERRCCC